MTPSSECWALNWPTFFFLLWFALHCALVFRHPVVVFPKQRQQCFAGTVPPPPSTCNKYFPSGLSPRWTQSNKQYGFFYWKPECLLERANDLIVDCVSMSECLTKLPTRVERRREEGREERRRGKGGGGKKTKLLTPRWEGIKWELVSRHGNRLAGVLG